MIIAIDGPAGSGKSTVAKLIAKELGFMYLDTGAMYRAITYKALRSGVSVDDASACAKISAEEPITFATEPGQALPTAVYISGEDITKEIRTAEVDANVSVCCAHPAVRELLVEQQRRIGANQNIVAEGRDVGTTVFPNAEVKFFLTASVDARAQRRTEQNIARGNGNTNFEEIKASIIARDEYDSNREVSPLRPAEDAIYYDTTDATIDEVVSRIVSCARERLNS